MRSSLRYAPILAGALALAGWVGTAEAQTAVNLGGASAARNFFTDIALNILDASPIPNRFASADGNKIVVTGNRGGSPVILRYSSGNGADGIIRLLQPASNPASNLLFLNHTLTTGCTGPVLTTRPSDGRQYNNTTGCNDGNTISLPVHVGASPIQGSTYHQTGPTGTTISPLDDSSLNGVPTAVVPLSLYLGKGVVRDVNGAPGGQIPGLNRLEIEAIFSRGVTDWKRLGYGTVADANPGQLEATSPIVLCLRNAGAGQKSMVDEVLLINVPETSVALPNAVIFSNNASGVVNCVASNRRSIGYAETEELVRFEAGGANAGLAYQIAIDGGRAYDSTLADPKQDLKCGRYAFWANLRLYRRVAGEGAAVDAVAQAFITNAGLQSTIQQIPSGRFWASDEELAVFKNTDRGPLLWKAGNHPECRK